jgi:hypothetical protein
MPVSPDAADAADAHSIPVQAGVGRFRRAPGSCGGDPDFCHGLFLHHHEGFGYLEGRYVITLPDCIYFSFTTYTTLGYGDIEPFGGIRYLAGFESLSGLLLITWTASFLFIEMQRYWVSK